MTVFQRLFKHDSCRYRCEYHGDHLEVCGLFCFLLWHYEVKCEAKVPAATCPQCGSLLRMDSNPPTPTGCSNESCSNYWSTAQSEPIVRKRNLEEKVDDIGRLIRGIHTKMFCTLERTSQPRPVEKAAKELARELNTHYRKHFLGDFNELSEDAQSVHIDVTTEIILSYVKERGL